MHIRISDRRRAPERVDGVEEGTTVKDVKKIACWVLGKVGVELRDVELVVEGTTLDNDERLFAEYSERENQLVLVDIKSKCGTTPHDKRTTCHEAFKKHPSADRAVTSLKTIRRLEMNDDDKSLVLRSSAAAVRLKPSKSIKETGQIFWNLNFAGDLFSSRSRTSFKIPWGGCLDGLQEATLNELSHKLLGLHVWSCESSADRSFIVLYFARERAAATWAHTHSKGLSVLPYDVLAAITSFLSPCGDMEISAINTETRLAYPLLPFSLHT
eukprot:TRINITY_DN9215_c0_g2_i1.p1 TRINITY_DN9215_c0_g2~~TRINITY_DN9215_c0_g2_i1.p1  ORF type:complete len:270 (+),score=46.85 TRINITY_DN9215_c0_g2_i1:69-878(+)